MLEITSPFGLFVIGTLQRMVHLHMGGVLYLLSCTLCNSFDLDLQGTTAYQVPLRPLRQLLPRYVELKNQGAWT